MLTPEARFARDFTPADRRWLASIHAAMPPREMPPHVVAIEQYTAIVDANDYITRENWRLRHGVRRLRKVAHVLREDRARWRQTAIALGALCAVFLAALVRAMR